MGVVKLTEARLMEETLTPHHMVKRLTPQLQLMEVKLTEDVLTPHHMERRLTHQPHLTEVKLTEVRLTEETLTLHHMERRLTHQPHLTEVKPTVETLTEVKLTEEETTEVNNTVTRRKVDYFANLFEDHQTPKKKSDINNFVLFFLCLLDIFNKLH